MFSWNSLSLSMSCFISLHIFVSIFKFFYLGFHLIYYHWRQSVWDESFLEELCCLEFSFFLCFYTEACVFDVRSLFRFFFQCHFILLVKISCNDEEEIDCSRKKVLFSSFHLVLRSSGSIPNTSPKVEYCLQKQSLSLT